METRTLGGTGVEVSRLGLGLAEIRGSGIENATAVLNRALDGGINVFDTAAGYGDSEELVGEAVGHRRDEFFLVTKAGAVTDEDGQAVWTAEGIVQSIDTSLQRLRTDRLDLLLLHTCTIHELTREEILGALWQAREAGKVRFVGFSGDNHAAQWCVDHGGFDVLETSLSVVDQNGRTSGLIRTAHERGMGLIAKRPLGNGVWGVVRHEQRAAKAAARGMAEAEGARSEPRGFWQRLLRRFAATPEVVSADVPDTETAEAADPISPFLRWAVEEDPVIRTYYLRALEMAELGAIDGEFEDAVRTSLGFTLAHPEIACAIVGTGNRDHIDSNVSLMRDGCQVSAGLVAEFQRRFDELGEEWTQIS